MVKNPDGTLSVGMFRLSSDSLLGECRRSHKPAIEVDPNRAVNLNFRNGEEGVTECQEYVQRCNDGVLDSTLMDKK